MSEPAREMGLPVSEEAGCVVGLDRRRLRVRIRRDRSNPVRPNAEQIDGRVFNWWACWVCEPDSQYPGEIAMMTNDADYPRDAPTWVASGDLEPAK